MWLSVKEKEGSHSPCQPAQLSSVYWRPDLSHTSCLWRSLTHISCFVWLSSICQATVRGLCPFLIIFLFSHSSSKFHCWRSDGGVLLEGERKILGQHLVPWKHQNWCFVELLCPILISYSLRLCFLTICFQPVLEALLGHEMLLVSSETLLGETNQHSWIPRLCWVFLLLWP